MSRIEALYHIAYHSAWFHFMPQANKIWEAAQQMQVRAVQEFNKVHTHRDKHRDTQTHRDRGRGV